MPQQGGTCPLQILLMGTFNIPFFALHGFSNKMSVLVGDYLLARASIALSELENFEVTALMSRVISDLIEGEFMQLDCYNFESYLQVANLLLSF